MNVYNEGFRDGGKAERERGKSERGELDRMINARISRGVKIEVEMFDCVAGKAPMPDKDKLRDWALRLGTPS
jgi:hypothetical protein